MKRDMYRAVLLDSYKEACSNFSGNRNYDQRYFVRLVYGEGAANARSELALYTGTRIAPPLKRVILNPRLLFKQMYPRLAGAVAFHGQRRAIKDAKARKVPSYTLPTAGLV